MRKKVLLIGALSALMLVSACSLASGLLPGGDDPAEASDMDVMEAPMEDELEEEDMDVDDEAESEAEMPDDSEEASESESEMVSTPPGTCSNSFFPIVEGPVWTYSSNAYGIEDTYTQSFRDVSEDGFTIVTDFEDGNEVEVAWECTEDGLISSEFLQMGMLQDMEFDLSTNEYSGVWIPPEEEWEVGKSWEAAYTVDINSEVEGVSIEMTMNIELTNTISAVEPVSVGAGDFDEAYRVDSTGVLAVDMFGTETPMEFVNWYVRDVGMVQSQVLSVDGLYDDSYDVELISLEE